MREIMDVLQPIIMNGVAVALGREDVQAALRTMVANEVAEMLLASAVPAVTSASASASTT